MLLTVQISQLFTVPDLQLVLVLQEAVSGGADLIAVVGGRALLGEPQEALQLAPPPVARGQRHRPAHHVIVTNNLSGFRV